MSQWVITWGTAIAHRNHTVRYSWEVITTQIDIFTGKDYGRNKGRSIISLASNGLAWILATFLLLI